MSDVGEIPLELHLESEYFPCDELQISRVSGQERISHLFRFEIFLTCRDPAGLDQSKVTGAPASLVFVDDGYEVRRIHGMIAELTDLLDSETQFYTYRLVLTPRALRTTLIRKQEVFIDTAVPDAITATLGLVGLDEDLELRLAREYAVREFIVQYRETDLAFISRLAEHLGVSFFFEHDGERDRMIFTDHKDGFRKPRDGERALFHARGEKRGVYRFDATSRVVPSFFVVSDYDYERPHIELASTFELADGFGGGLIEYGTNYRDPDEGAALAQVRAEELLPDALSFVGESTVYTLSAGGRFVLEDHPRLGTLELLVIEVEHHHHETALGSGASMAEIGYKNTFRAIPASTSYRPPRVTPRPRIHGVTSGIIEAAPGIETHLPWIDKQGRYYVRVLFDTARPGERKASLPIRMAQAHSGPGYGIHFPLRPGIEVLLAFIDGDPDRPVIMGSVPNALTPTPVNESERSLHRIRTYSGVRLEIDDES